MGLASGPRADKLPAQSTAQTVFILRGRAQHHGQQTRLANRRACQLATVPTLRVSNRMTTALAAGRVLLAHTAATAQSSTTLCEPARLYALSRRAVSRMRREREK